MSLGRSKETRELVRKLKALGCEVRPHKGHWKVYRDGEYVATVPSTPSDHRTMLNVRAQLRRIGLQT
jgi:hypothetical protein